MPSLVKCPWCGKIYGKEDEHECPAKVVASPAPASSLFTDMDDSVADAARDEAEARDAAAFLADLEDLQHDERYGWALGTIEGIHETVTRTQSVTSNQRRAIENITAKVERGYR